MEPFIAQITLFASDFAPRGWALCQGQLLSVVQNTALFSLIGITYGGNGVQTFTLPDLRGRVPIQPGQGPGLSNYIIGEVGGVEHETLLITQLPQHNHMLMASNQIANSANPSGNFPAVTTDAAGTGADPRGYLGAADTTMNPMAITPTGGNQPFSIMQPFLAINFIIAMEGVFPSRS